MTPLTRRSLLAGTFAAAGCWGAGVLSASARAASPAVAPVRNGGRRWRIGYAETMPYGNYVATLVAIVNAMVRLGWLDDVHGLPYTPGQTDSVAVWSWLAGHDHGPFVEFVADAHVANLDRQPADAIIGRLSAERDIGRLSAERDIGRLSAERDIGWLSAARDIDLMIVMGTVAGVKLATDAHSVPVLVFSSTNPVAAGIVASETDTGRDHVWAHLDPRRFQRQLAIFHKTFRFQRLGIAYEDSPVGRAIAALPDIESVADRLGFQLVRRHVRAPAGETDQARYDADLGAAWDDLSQAADAMYITYGRWAPDRFPELIRPFLSRRVPTFSQLGPEEVEKGALMSIARADMTGIGEFGATVIARTLNGEPPRRLPQVYFDTPTIAWNIATAAAIGYRIPFPALLAADALYGEP